MRISITGIEWDLIDEDGEACDVKLPTDLEVQAPMDWADEGRLHDPQAFWDAAYERLCSENGTTSPEDAAEHLGTRDEPALGRCAQMLIDPGISPAGCQIEQSSAEEVTTLPAVEPFLIREF